MDHLDEEADDYDCDADGLKKGEVHIEQCDVKDQGKGDFKIHNGCNSRYSIVFEAQNLEVPASEDAESIAKDCDQPEKKHAFFRLLLFAGEEPFGVRKAKDGT